MTKSIIVQVLGKDVRLIFNDNLPITSLDKASKAFIENELNNGHTQGASVIKYWDKGAKRHSAAWQLVDWKKIAGELYTVLLQERRIIPNHINETATKYAKYFQ